MEIYEIETPALLLDKQILLKNIKDMAEMAEKYGVKLRPHIKAHKCSQIANLQMENGAVGITVAKLGEAEVMLEAGVKNIVIAYQLVDEAKLKRLKALMEKGADITCLVDNIEQVILLDHFGEKNNLVIAVYAEIDSGLKRTGLQPDDIVDFVEKLIKFKNIKFSGLLTHAGHVYGAQRDKVALIGQEEGQIMERVNQALVKAGIFPPEVSVGSTPTVRYSASNPKVTEIRPGNYVFNDAIQIGLGVAALSDCSLKVLATVISKPAADRLVIDAGSKTLALDKGAHGTELVKGFGIIEGYPNLTIERLSEEHGIVLAEEGNVPEIGDKIAIIPNHACPVVNLADEMMIVEGSKVLGKWQIDARGKNK
ncbi:MAG: alanine racemase [Peptococcaceae bacterium]